MIGNWSLISQDRVTSRPKHKEKEQRGRFGEIDEKMLREEYTLDWLQSKVFSCVIFYYQVCHVIHTATSDVLLIVQYMHHSQQLSSTVQSCKTIKNKSIAAV